MSKESVKEKVLKNFLRGEEIVFEGLARYLVRKGRRCIDRRVAFVHFFHSHFFVLFKSRFCTVFVYAIFHWGGVEEKKMRGCFERIMPLSVIGKVPRDRMISPPGIIPESIITTSRPSVHTLTVYTAGFGLSTETDE